MQGNRYDCSGHFSGKDCSTYIQDIFNTFGIDIPRNTSEISHINGKIINLENLSEDNRNKSLQILPMKEHIFMYLGFIENQHYVISDIASVGGRR